MVDDTTSRRNAARAGGTVAAERRANRAPLWWWLAAPLAAALSCGCAASAISSSSTGSSPASVGVTPQTASVLLGNSMTLTASVSGSSSGVNWSVAGIAGGSSTVGHISTAGVFTAPAVLPSPATETVQAALATDATVTGSAQVTITSDISVSIAPTAAAVELGAQQTFSASITSAGNPSTAVTWSLSGSGCAGASCGTISSAGVFTAPPILPSPPTVLLTATSVADPSKSASVPLTVTSHFAFQLSGPSQVAAGSTGDYAATLTPAPNSNPSTAISWSVAGSGCTGSACGAIVGSSTGSGSSAVYMAPATIPSPNQVTITATPAADPSKAASMLVTITPPTAVTVTVAPTPVTLAPNATQTFTATVAGTSNQQVSWSISGSACSATGNPCGTVDVNGNYQAPGTPPAPNSFEVIATSAANPGSTGFAAVTISTLPVISSLAPTSATAGSAGGFTLEVEGANFVASSPGPGSTLVVGGTLRTTSCSTSLECSTALAAADLAGAGNLTVQVQNPGGNLSGVVDFVVAPAVTSRAVVSLSAGSPAATDENVTVVDLSTNGSSLPAQDVTLALAAMGAFNTSTDDCTLGAAPLEIIPPSSGSITSALCAFSVSGLDPSYSYTLTGPSPPDIVVAGTDPLGLGIVYMNLQIAANAQAGARTLFVRSPELDMTAATGSLDVQ